MIFALTLATFVLTLVLIALVLKGNRIMATTQTQLEAYIENTLTPALTSLEATGAQVAAAVNALVAAYQAGAADLTPQLNELTAAHLEAHRRRRAKNLARRAAHGWCAGLARSRADHAHNPGNSDDAVA